MAVVVSAVGGKPKVTDLLLSSVRAAASGETQVVGSTLNALLQKHEAILDELFGKGGAPELREVITKDVQDVRDILKGVTLIGEAPQSVYDVVSGYGELWSTQILAKELAGRTKESVKPFVFVDARRFIRVHPGQGFTPLVVDYEESAKFLQKVIKEEESGDFHMVITGFICRNADTGVATTLQRDGSDFTAAIVGKLLRARAVTIWTDVDGVLSADPRKVASARCLRSVSYAEAMELSYFGARVMHPRTMMPCVTTNTPIYIRNSFRPSHPGTKIWAGTMPRRPSRLKLQMQRSGASEGMGAIADAATSSSSSSSSSSPSSSSQTRGARVNALAVKGLSVVDNLMLVNVEGGGMMGVPGVAKRLFSALESHNCNVIFIAQASSEHSICVAVAEKDSGVAAKAIADAFHLEISGGGMQAPQLDGPCAIVAAVGDNMAFCPGVAGRFFSALAVAEINVVAISQGSSERNISAVVASKDAAAALAAAHSAFFLDLDGEGEGEGEGEKKEAGGAGAGSKVDKAQASREPLSPRRREMQDEIDRLTKEVGKLQLPGTAATAAREAALAAENKALKEELRKLREG